jgi:hypothetical protein
MLARHFPERDIWNNRLENLRWGTQKQNSADRWPQGTVQLGSNHPRSIFTEQQVIKIRELFATGKYTQKQLAKQFNCSISAIKGIWRRRIWTHVGGPSPFTG